mgnify:CR=1 FL=1
MSTSAADLDTDVSGARGNTAGPVLSLRPLMFAEAVAPAVEGMTDEQRYLLGASKTPPLHPNPPSQPGQPP